MIWGRVKEPSKTRLFVWFPVPLENGGWAWLEHVHRRYNTYLDESEGRWTYYLPN